MACPYATALGLRGKGVHATRIFGFALFDILATVAVAFLTSYIYKVSLFYSLLGWFVLGELLHILYGVDTAFLESIGLLPYIKSMCEPKKN